jgi:hypothetical protein
MLCPVDPSKSMLTQFMLFDPDGWKQS